MTLRTAAVASCKSYLRSLREVVLVLHPPLRSLGHGVNPRDGPLNLCLSATDFALSALCSAIGSTSTMMCIKYQPVMHVIDDVSVPMAPLCGISLCCCGTVSDQRAAQP
jgi:hypothetical protein